MAVRTAPRLMTSRLPHRRGRALRRVRTVDVDRRRALAGAPDHGGGGLLGGVRLAVHGVRRDAQEVARPGVDGVPATGAELEAHRAADDVEARLVLAVVVPA